MHKLSLLLNAFFLSTSFNKFGIVLGKLGNKCLRKEFAAITRHSYGFSEGNAQYGTCLSVNRPKINKELYFDSSLLISKTLSTSIISKISQEMDAEVRDSSDEHRSPTNPQLFKDVTEEGWKLTSEEFLTFPVDPVTENYVRRNVVKAVFSLVLPTPMEGEHVLAAVSATALDLLDLDPIVASTTRFRDLVSGSWQHPGSTPLAHRYGGHQFGWWANQLGDGRAHLLGHYTNRHNSWWEVQLKGSGSTPYSRNGDGRAVIRSSVREFLAAEAMHALGVRTSRCASLVVGAEKVVRSKLYDGNISLENVAVVARLAHSWFRFGSFEILAKKDETEILRLLVDHVITRHYPDLDPGPTNVNPEGSPSDRPLALLSVVVDQTAEMIAQWQAVGFAHGVMNTDNMSILSVTIDYGPFGFLDVYNPNFIPNYSDDEGRYSYARQPQVGYENLVKFADALRPLLSQSQLGQIKAILGRYDPAFKEAYLKIFMGKLGIPSHKPDDEKLVTHFLKLMEESKADFTMSFWELGNISLPDLKARNLPKAFWSLDKMVKKSSFSSFLEAYEARILENGGMDEERMSVARKFNPRYLLRNWIAQQVIEDADKGDYRALQLALKVLQAPYEIHSEAEKRGWAEPPPPWACKLKVSCSS